MKRTKIFFKDKFYNYLNSLCKYDEPKYEDDTFPERGKMVVGMIEPRKGCFKTVSICSIKDNHITHLYDGFTSLEYLDEAELINFNDLHDDACVELTYKNLGTGQLLKYMISKLELEVIYDEVDFTDLKNEFVVAMIVNKYNLTGDWALESMYLVEF